MLRFTKHIIAALVFVCSLSTAQQDPNLPSLYREDQIYIGASFMGLIQSNTEENPAGLSSHFHFGLVRDMPLNAKGNWAIAGGLGFQTQRIITAVMYEFGPDEQPLRFYGQGKTESQIQTRFGVQSIEVPLVLRWRTSTPTRYQFWRIYGGLKWFWNLKTKVVGLPKSFDTQEYFNRTHLESFVSFGYNTWNFYVSYPIQKVVNPIPLEDGSAPYDFNLIKVGLIFYLL